MDKKLKSLAQKLVDVCDHGNPMTLMADIGRIAAEMKAVLASHAEIKVTNLSWSKTDEHTWHAGPYKVLESTGEAIRVYEVWDWLGEFDTLQKATDEADRHWRDRDRIV